jgi:hypothetical protein
MGRKDGPNDKAGSKFTKSSWKFEEGIERLIC